MADMAVPNGAAPGSNPGPAGTTGQPALPDAEMEIAKFRSQICERKWFKRLGLDNQQEALKLSEDELNTLAVKRIMLGRRLLGEGFGDSQIEKINEARDEAKTFVTQLETRKQIIELLKDTNPLRRLGFADSDVPSPDQIAARHRQMKAFFESNSEEGGKVINALQAAASEALLAAQAARVDTRAIPTLPERPFTDAEKESRLKEGFSEDEIRNMARNRLRYGESFNRCPWSPATVDALLGVTCKRNQAGEELTLQGIIKPHIWKPYSKMIDFKHGGLLHSNMKEYSVRVKVADNKLLKDGRGEAVLEASETGKVHQFKGDTIDRKKSINLLEEDRANEPGLMNKMFGRLTLQNKMVWRGVGAVSVAGLGFAVAATEGSNVLSNIVATFVGHSLPYQALGGVALGLVGAAFTDSMRCVRLVGCIYRDIEEALKALEMDWSDPFRMRTVFRQLLINVAFRAGLQEEIERVINVIDSAYPERDKAPRTREEKEHFVPLQNDLTRTMKRVVMDDYDKDSWKGKVKTYDDATGRLTVGLNPEQDFHGRYDVGRGLPDRYAFRYVQMLNSPTTNLTNYVKSMAKGYWHLCRLCTDWEALGDELTRSSTLNQVRNEIKGLLPHDKGGLARLFFHFQYASDEAWRSTLRYAAIGSVAVTIGAQAAGPFLNLLGKLF